MSNNFYNDNNIDNSVPFNSLSGQIAETKNNNNIFKVTCETTYDTTNHKSNATGGGTYFSGQYVPIKVTRYFNEKYKFTISSNGNKISLSNGYSFPPIPINDTLVFINYYFLLVSEDMDIEINFIAL